MTKPLRKSPPHRYQRLLTGIAVLSLSVAAHASDALWATGDLAPTAAGSDPGLISVGIAMQAGDDGKAPAPFLLGAVVDVRTPHPGGLPVLAVTPGGPADRMGLQVGDRIVSMNDHPLAGAAEPAAAFSRALHAGAGRLRLQALRNGQELTLSGKAETRIFPTGEGCGYVTTLGTTPHVSQNIFSGDITMIDGSSTPLFPVNRHQLDAGRHVLIVAERIPDYRLSGPQNRQRSLMKRRESIRGFYKAIVIDIKPDTSYSIGARLIRDKLDADGIRANAYWEPVVWQERAEACR